MAPVGAIQRPRRTLTAARALFILSVLVAGVSSCRGAAPLTSELEFLTASWESYRRLYIHADGFVLDRTRNGGEVTSEGQAYALLRAAWIGDSATFERVFAWTEQHLRRPDGLYSWRWSPRGGGVRLDDNSAADADQDIAFALILGSVHFRRPDYRARAAALLHAIRAHESVDVGSGWFPAGGNWAVGERIVNLSYFTPYAYPYFDRIAPEDGWLVAQRTGYQMLQRAAGETRLPPDFMTVSLNGDPGPLPDTSQLSRTFSFDGIRIPWRIEMDCRIHGTPEACGEAGLVSTLVNTLQSSGAIVSEYDTAAKRLTDLQSPTFYACLLPVLQRRHPDLADTVRRTQLSLPQLESVLEKRDRYYDANWLWFGIALAEGLIPARTPPLDALR